ncbi:DUF3318 domain-containing protein [Candidatus Vallotia lariciata]|uniref:DUF3318 domain-containing protein n=1 Tax=Candidatus Vallotia laricis TaxID=2018052 RepID=UPI001D02F9BB|nr:DUF3318 domain-containing protein [Candidatus Vallotia lariciata]UDG82975.1 hypothetical protein GKR41_00338 [Candidatus Vallotia lariciata]
MNNPYLNSHPAYPMPIQSSNYSKATGKVRKLRKEVLIARADRNRLDIVNASQEICQDISRLNWIRWLMPGISKYQLLCGFSLTIRKLLNQYPLFSSIASATLAASVRRMVIQNAKPLLKWTVISAAAWKIYGLWRAERLHQDATSDHGCTKL